MKYRCIRHLDNQVTHFCSQPECENHLRFFCFKCVFQQCIKGYHLEEVESLSDHIQKITLPNINKKQWDYCSQQLSKLKEDLNGLLEKIVADFDENVELIIAYIKERSSQHKSELEQLLSTQIEIVGEKELCFTAIIEEKIQKFGSHRTAIEEILSKQVESENIEDFYKECRISQLFQDYKQIVLLQPELDQLVQENSLQINKEQQLRVILQENKYDKYRSQIEFNLENAMNIVWGKYYQMTDVFNFPDQRNSSIAESEILTHMIRKSRTNTQSVIQEIDNIISMAQHDWIPDNQNKLSRASYGFTVQNLISKTVLSIKMCDSDLNLEPSHTIVPYSILPVKNANIVFTSGESNEIYIWSYKQDSRLWKVEQRAQLVKEPLSVQCMELVHNPNLNDSRNSRQSFATLKVFLNPIVAVGAGMNIFLIQYDILTNKPIVQARFPIKDSSDTRVACIMSCQKLGSYNYFIVGMDKGSLLVFSYIIGIDNSFTIRLDYVVRHHQDCITSMEVLNDSYFAVSSVDRSVSVWKLVNNKPKLTQIRMNRFWEDITCIRSVGQSFFLTCDMGFNVILWHMENENQVKLVQQFSCKTQGQIHDAVVINNPEHEQDFCVLVLASFLDAKQTRFKVLLFDRQLKLVISEESLNNFSFNSQASLQTKKSKQKHYITNGKMRIISDQNQNKRFLSYSDIRQSLSERPLSQGQQELSKQVSFGIVNQNNKGFHFIEYQLRIGD